MPKMRPAITFIQPSSPRMSRPLSTISVSALLARYRAPWGLLWDIIRTFRANGSLSQISAVDQCCRSWAAIVLSNWLCLRIALAFFLWYPNSQASLLQLPCAALCVLVMHSWIYSSRDKGTASLLSLESRSETVTPLCRLGSPCPLCPALSARQQALPASAPARSPRLYEQLRIPHCCCPSSVLTGTFPPGPLENGSAKHLPSWLEAGENCTTPCASCTFRVFCHQSCSQLHSFCSRVLIMYREGTMVIS